MPEISQSDLATLNNYRAIFYTYKYGERAPELTREDEKLLEDIYNRWRGGQEVILDCDDCVEEALNRLMEEMIAQEKKRLEV